MSMSEKQSEQINILDNVTSVLEDVTDNIGKGLSDASEKVSNEIDTNKEKLKQLFNMTSNSNKDDKDEEEQNDDEDDELDNDDELDDDDELDEDDELDDDDELEVDNEEQNDGDDNEELDEEEESDEESDEETFQKFDVDMTNNIIVNSHPESILHNNDEVQKMTKVSRNKNNIIIDKLHRTIPIMTKFEKTKILGERCKQLQCGSLPFVDIEDGEGYMDEYLIANRELQEKKIPFIIRRPLPNGGSEYWDIRDLELLY